ncbi:MAG: 30S ribosomal protein S1 [Armatimonadetes bacterium]|nr:30S ribosomal protein S1 [Armatimonadota bacterium]
MFADDNDDQSKLEPTADTLETDAGDDTEDEGPQEDWAELAEAGPAEVKPGDIITGVVAGVNNEGVSVDIGAKLEGLIPRGEFASEADLPKVDDEIAVCVVRIDDEAGIIKVSKRRADFAQTWIRLEEAAQSGELVDAMVSERVKGGLRVDVGVPGFIPASQVGTRDVRNLDRFVGRSLRLKVLEADRRSKKVILSHRQVVEEEREKHREETLANLEEGTVVEGKVRNLTNYGAFVDLGGVDGLLHVSEMSWTRIKDPSEVLKVGESITVTVLEINAETGKISLSRRQILPDPWKEAARQLKPGKMVKARITRVVRTGAFAQLQEAGIEGFIPVSEMSSRRINDPSDVVSAGQEVDLRINDIRVEARRMTLSLVAAEQEKERQEYREYMKSQKQAPVTLGDRFAHVFEGLTAPAESAASEAPAAEGEPAPAPVEEAAPEEAAPAAEEEAAVTEEVATESADAPAAVESGEEDAGEEEQAE